MLESLERRAIRNMNKVISREYVEKNYIHKDVIREILNKYGKKPMVEKNVVRFYRELEKKWRKNK